MLRFGSSSTNITDWYWDLGDGTEVIGDNGFNHDYADGSPKTVKLYQGTLTGIEAPSNPITQLCIQCPLYKTV